MTRKKEDKEYKEEHFFKTHRKEERAKKKLASSKDRSKHKKTDKVKREVILREEAQKRLLNKELIKGRVLSITPESITCDVGGVFLLCTLRGSLKKEKGQKKNLITVGDFVLIEKNQENEGVICFVENRFSVLSRASHLHRRQEQLIAANIDQVLITVSLASPPLKPGLVDRYIIASIKGGMQPVIIVNKIDLLKKGSKEEVLFNEFTKTYHHLGFTVIPMSAKTGKGLQALEKAMQNKASVFSGQSGTGKSSLINAITGLSLKTQEIIKKTQKGAHTTSNAHLIPLNFGGWCIDTPGIRSFGIWDLSQEDLRHYFPEIKEAATYCKYPNCTHTHEPDCCLNDLIAEGKISSIRFESYQKLLQELS